MVQEQSRRLQAMSDELDTVRAALNERKLVERAKGLLMAHRRLSEDEAYKALRQMAMNQNRRLVDVAESVLAMADVLPSRALRLLQRRRRTNSVPVGVNGRNIRAAVLGPESGLPLSHAEG